MGLDINMIRPDKGGNPDLIRESLKKLYQDHSIVDEIILDDQLWRKCIFQINNF